MAESFTHMEAVPQIIWGTLDSAEERMAELAPAENYLAGLVRELAGYEQRVREAEAAGEAEAVKLWKRQAEDVKAELERLGAVAEPRAKTRK